MEDARKKMSPETPPVQILLYQWQLVLTCPICKYHWTGPYISQKCGRQGAFYKVPPTRHFGWSGLSEPDRHFYNAILEEMRECQSKESYDALRAQLPFPDYREEPFDYLESTQTRRPGDRFR